MFRITGTMMGIGTVIRTGTVIGMGTVMYKTKFLTLIHNRIFSRIEYGFRHNNCLIFTQKINKIGVARTFSSDNSHKFTSFKVYSRNWRFFWMSDTSICYLSHQTWRLGQKLCHDFAKKLDGHIIESFSDWFYNFSWPMQF